MLWILFLQVPINLESANICWIFSCVGNRTFDFSRIFNSQNCKERKKCQNWFLWFSDTPPVALGSVSWATFNCNLNGRFVAVQRNKLYSIPNGNQNHYTWLALSDVYFFTGEYVEKKWFWKYYILWALRFHFPVSYVYTFY